MVLIPKAIVPAAKTPTPIQNEGFETIAAAMTAIALLQPGHHLGQTGLLDYFYNKQTCLNQVSLYLWSHTHPHLKTFQLPDHNTGCSGNTIHSRLDSVMYPEGVSVFSGCYRLKKVPCTSKHRRCDTTKAKLIRNIPETI